ncbi:putative hydroxydechloroatrazine ethylaminohydrolase [Aurantimonas manganoxydans SI85-9A1]|uniref:Putative hydroxydechloroatrazine ethylaminohydrolase n=1 Tax=Aurantimonas manganoxydans (strain ATCC BAA-1229 / DSM 21871 / SI85-9A1) TaxID=287752 RepID=Q1YG05_AURMS|nr:8-oxoguanine deaminase [Aurantimonas manganoxydans]EAS49420.1 putative hydroxydechloroatrazine ethylaminohydrolase [Aurantimonas manganoxydans SI85-9A1]
MTRLWLKTPLAILAEGADGGIVVEDGRIVELVPSGGEPQAPVDETFDAARHVVLPGLVNTHHHFYQTLTRAHPQAIDKELFPWLESLYPIWARLDPDSFRLSVRLALTELLMSGCTTAADHHYLFPKGLEDAIDIEAEEAAALGIRVTLTRGSMNLSQKDGGLPPDSVVQDEDEILADSERLIGRWHDRSDGAMTQIALAPCSPFSVTKSLMMASAELAERHDCRLHTHLGETEDENRFCVESFGCRPVDYLEDVGWLGPRTWLAHGIHFTTDECRRLGAHKVGVCHCPASNAVLASGFCPVNELRAAGSPVGLGVDGSASNDASNLIEAARHALMVGRLNYRSAEAVTARDVLAMGTEGSAACLGRTDIGRIAVGMQADLALFTLDELRFSGAHDPIAALVLCGATRADRVMVKGQWRVEDGMPVGIDIARLRAAHGAAALRFA